MTKNEFINFITNAQKFLQKRYELNHLTFAGCCMALDIGNYYALNTRQRKVIGERMIRITSGCRENRAYYLGDFTDENLFKRMMVLECLMEEMINDGSYKEL